MLDPPSVNLLLLRAEPGSQEADRIGETAPGDQYPDGQDQGNRSQGCPAAWVVEALDSKVLRQTPQRAAESGKAHRASTASRPPGAGAPSGASTEAWILRSRRHLRAWGAGAPAP